MIKKTLKLNNLVKVLRLFLDDECLSINDVFKKSDLSMNATRKYIKYLVNRDILIKKHKDKRTYKLYLKQKKNIEFFVYFAEMFKDED